MQDKKSAVGIISLQPSWVTGLLYRAQNLWDDHIWWPGCPTLCDVFYGNDASPLPSTTNHHVPRGSISLLKWLLTAPLRSEKYFIPLTLSGPSTQRLYIHSSAGLIYVPPLWHQVWACRLDRDDSEWRWLVHTVTVVMLWGHTWPWTLTAVYDVSTFTNPHMWQLSVSCWKKCHFVK